MKESVEINKETKPDISKKTIIAGFIAMKNVIFLLILGAVVFGGLILYTGQWYREFKVAENQNLKLIELNGVIIHLDEVLTMSANMAAATGDPTWEQRYRKFEPQLGIAIKIAVNLASATFMLDADVTSTDAANKKLIVMENEVFDLVRQDNRQTAMALLNSQEYKEQKTIYKQGMKRFVKTMRGHMEGRLAKQRKIVLGAAGFVGIAMSVVAFIWFGMVQMYRRLTDRKQKETTLRRQAFSLNEQVKELNCLYGISRLVAETEKSMDDIFRGAVEWIQLSWRYPDITCVRIFIEDRQFKTDNFKQTEWKQSTDIIAWGEKIGAVEVFYLQEKPAIDEGPFLKEERELVNALGRQLGSIIERKQAEEKQAELLEQVEEVNKELKDFAYIVSHDLKAPLRGIKQLSEWLSADYADTLGEEGQEHLHLLGTRVDRMHNLIDGVLQYSRAGRANDELVMVDLNKLMTEIIDMVAAPENITITVENQLPIVECEETRIMQVFGNLLSNAVKYMDKDEGGIKIGCSEEEDFWKFSISDNGCGIKEEHYEKIFEVFRTLLPRDEYESTGIGLSVVKKIIDGYGGKIWVESEHEQGSTFFFTMPRQENGVAYAELEANTAC